MPTPDRPEQHGVSPADLQVADIIFTSGETLVSRFARLVTGATYTHAFLSIGAGHAVDSTDAGVQRKPIDAALVDTTHAVVMRKRGLTDAQRAEIRTRALAFVGRPFDYVGAMGAGAATATPGAVGLLLLVPGLVPAAYRNASEANRDARLFCAELVCRAYELSGVPLARRHASFVMPNELHLTPDLDCVGWLRPPARG